MLSGCVACSGLFYKNTRVALYTVHSGETLSSIARKFSLNYREIADLNDLSGDTIYAGQQLEIPLRNVYGIKKAKKQPVKVSKPTSTLKISKGKHQLYAVPRGSIVKPMRIGTYRKTSKFGWRWMRFHEGLDYGAKHGTPIYAAHSGRVLFSGDKLSGYGNMIILEGKNILTVYAHNRRNRVGRGAYVKRGQKIAEVGSSGKATGPHLHFELRIKNDQGAYVAVDPELYF